MQKNRKGLRKGFTLIELLVVIAIIAVLAVVVILTLNPAGLLQEARDSNRISDMATLKSAISLYLADVPSPALGTTGQCYLSLPSSSPNITGTPLQVPSGTVAVATSTCLSYFSSTATTTMQSSTNYRSVTGTTGWIPVNLSSLSAGAPFGLWPVDPVNTTNYFYSYIANSAANTFKIAMFMESTKYKTTGTADVETPDGGTNNFVFEGGSNLSL